MFVFLNPKTTDHVASGMSPSDIAGAIGDRSTAAPNAFGTSEYFKVDPDTKMPNWDQQCTGKMQTLEDVGAPDLPILGIGSVTYSNYDSSSGQSLSINVYNPDKPREYDYDLWAHGLASPEASSGATGAAYGPVVPGVATSGGTVGMSRRVMRFYKDPLDPTYGSGGYVSTYPLTRELINSLRYGLWHRNIFQVTQTEPKVPKTMYYYYIVVELAEAPTGTPTGLTPASGTTVTTARPTVGLTTVKPASNQLFGAQWQFATDSGFTQDVILVTESTADFKSAATATTETLTNDKRLTKQGVWYFRGRVIDEFGQVGPWTTANTLTVDVADPSVPTGIAPVQDATINTSVPVLQAIVTDSSDHQLCKIEWQLATDSGFTQDLRSVIEPDSHLRVSGLTTYQVPDASKLSQTTWYIRARQIDQYGQVSSWSTSSSFLITHPPSASNPLPTNGQSVIYALNTKFSWLFSDTSSVDTQTAYQIIIEKNSDGTQIIDTAKTASANNFANISLSEDLKDVLLRWKLRVWDSDDVAGSYSPYSLFKVSDAPVLTIISPEDDSTIQSGRPNITWSFSASAGRTMASWRVQFTKVGSSAPSYDTGTRSGSALSFAPDVTVIKNQESFNITVTVTDNVGLSASETITVTAEYVVPQAVVYSVEGSFYRDLGYVYISWQAIVDPGFIRWRIYRRIALPDHGFEVAGEVDDRDVTQFKDWLAPAQNIYEYIVVQVVDRFGEEVESDTPGVPLQAALGVGDYWLIDPLDESNNIKLSQVKQDDYTLEIEQSSYVVAGRGRHVDYGEVLGDNGSLTAQLRDTVASTAREKKEALEAVTKKRRPLYLRNPFGGVTRVAIGNPSISRIQGSGSSEFCDVTVPYLEIF